MLYKPIRLAEKHTSALEELLLADAPTNLFLLGYLDAVSLSRSHWYAITDTKRLHAVVAIITGRLAVPYAPNPDHAVKLGRVLQRRHRPTMVVGPREAVDAMWSEWAPGVEVDRWYDQRLYLCDRAMPGERVSGFRRAHTSEWEQVAVNSAAMETEDLGRSPDRDDPEAWHATVKRRIEQGTTWVIERDQEVIFQINVGTRTPFGVQVGGTYVPPRLRRQGLATAGMLELGRRLVPKHTCITLHVNEANTPAVRVYERSGYRPYAPFRLITLPT